MQNLDGNKDFDVVPGKVMGVMAGCQWLVASLGEEIGVCVNLVG